jgi:hypothetical protein
MTVDDEGRPAAVLSWCPAHRPDVVLTWFSDSYHEYPVPADAVPPATVALPDLPATLPEPDARYRMYGVARDSAFTTLAVSFTPSDRPAPGTVLTGEDDATRGTLTLDDFTARGTREC